MTASILIVDDDLDLLQSAEDLLGSQYRVKTAGSVEKAKALIAREEFDVVIADLNFEGHELDGIALLDYLNHQVAEPEIVVLSGDQVTSRIVNAMKRNLVDFVPKEGDYETVLKNAVSKALEKRRLRFERESEAEFLTNSPKMMNVLRVARKIASSPGQFPILIQGETGTGKEVLAKYLAKLVRKNIVAANMASIPRETAESELFGHVKGSFTGAVSNRVGLLEQANRGVFFLDELGECSPQIQAKLLRAVQEREVLPVGANVPRKVDVRFVSATHRDLEQMVQEGNFREDLLQRLNTFVLKIPALRERPEDIILYSNRFLAELDHGRKLTLEATGINSLMNFSWPGNVRQLRNIIERIALLTESGKIDQAAVENAIGNVTKAARLYEGSSGVRSKVLGALEMESGNRLRAAIRLGVHPTTLRRWIRKHGVAEAFEATPGRPPLLSDRIFRK